jgi:hypothetical protein
MKSIKNRLLALLILITFPVYATVSLWIREWELVKAFFSALITVIVSGRTE